MRPSDDQSLNQALARRADSLIGSAIDSSTELLAKQTHDVVRLAMGAPSEDLLPLEQLNEALSMHSPGRFDYGETAGEPSLRDEIVKLTAEMGISTLNDRILVTNGAMQGLDIAFKLFVNPGDLVVVESPTYTNALATALSYEARIMTVPVDEDGLDVDALVAKVKKSRQKPTIIYTIPTFQNPTGVTLSKERRLRLLELAETWGSVIVDDDPYTLLRFEGSKVPSFSELSPFNPLIFRVQSFSKLVAPGLRIGWIDVDSKLKNLAVNAKQALDTCTNVPNQLAIAQFLGAQQLAPYLKTLLPMYKERKDAMVASLRGEFGDSVTFTNPHGGLFMWVDLKGPYAKVNTSKLFDIALEFGVAYVPGVSFSPDGIGSHSLRLSYGASSPLRIQEGIRRLKKALGEFQRRAW